MIKINVTYENPDGKEVSKDLYFHMSMRQLTKMEVQANGGLHDMLQKLVASENKGEMLALFEDIIGKAYGEREENDPDSFLQTPRITEKFMGSMAYDALFTKLVTSPAEMIKFINGLIPKELMSAVEAQGGLEEIMEKANLPAEDSGPKLLTYEELVEATGLKHPKDDKGNLLPWAKREATTQEQMRMTKHQLLDCMQRKTNGWTPRD